MTNNAKTNRNRAIVEANAERYRASLSEAELRGDAAGIAHYQRLLRTAAQLSR